MDGNRLPQDLLVEAREQNTRLQQLIEATVRIIAPSWAGSARARNRPANGPPTHEALPELLNVERRLPCLLAPPI
jgi:hypothetical protein